MCLSIDLYIINNIFLIMATNEIQKIKKTLHKTLEVIWLDSSYVKNFTIIKVNGIIQIHPDTKVINKLNNIYSNSEVISILHKVQNIIFNKTGVEAQVYYWNKPVSLIITSI